jgi:hypothetical protein
VAEQLSLEQSNMSGNLVDGRASGWGVNSGCSISVTTDANGDKCVQVVTAGASPAEGVLNSSPVFYGTPGRTYIISVSVRGSGSVRVRAGSSMFSCWRQVKYRAKCSIVSNSCVLAPRYCSFPDWTAHDAGASGGDSKTL